MANLRTDNLCGEGGRNAYRGSVFFDGDNDYIDISNSVIAAAIPGGDEPYTIEMWVLFGRGGSEVDSGGSDSLIAYGSNSTRSYNGIDWTGTAIRNVWFGDDLSYTVDLVDGAWHHIAATYDQTTRRLFVDGNLGASDTPSDHSVGTTNNGKIGASTGGVINRDFKGYISNLRITKRAIYTAAFTPPTQELTAVDDTMLLCCQDSNDPNQEATGKTITGNGNLATTGYLETQPKVIPPYGVDAGNTFNGAISMNSSAYMNFPTGRTEERVIVNNNFGTRGLVFQGLTYPSAPSSTYLNTIEFITVATKGNATDFGDLISKANSGAGAGNLTRGIQVSGNDPSGATNVIQFVTIATTGDAQDFGDVGYERCNAGAVSNQTRLVYSGGEGMSSPYPKLNNIEFITFASTGNGTDFGDQVTLVNSPYGVSSPTRGVFMGGSGATPVIQKIEIATTGNSVLFGDLTSALYNVRGTITNGHRGVMAGGVISPTGRVNNIDFITIQSGGKSITFGDLTDARDPSNLSSMTRGVMLSGDYPANVNIMDFIEIMTTGNAVDFGDCNKSSASSTASNGHGGLADAM